VPATTFPGWHFHPSVWLVVAALGGGYLWCLRTVGPRVVPAGEPVVRRGQVALFMAGVLVVWLAADWPVHDLSEDYLFSAHMVQHTLLSLVAPPLLLLGTPAWLARWLLSPPPVMAVMRQVTRPLVALAVFNGVIVFTHWPLIVEAGLRSEGVHFLLHALLMSTATLMWFPVLSPLPELPRLQPAAQMLYLFLQSIVPTVPASFLTLADGPVYKIYGTLPKLWGLTTVEDQRIAGLIMKVVGGLILWGFIAAIFFRWAFREEERDRRSRVLTWDELEGELERMGSTAAPS
jgi:putative membrane protein